MTVVSPTSWHVASWTLRLLRTCTSSCPFKGNLPVTTWRRCTLPAYPPAVQRLAPTLVLPSPFSSIPGSSCLRGIPTLCKLPWGIVRYCVSDGRNYTPLPRNNNFPSATSPKPDHSFLFTASISDDDEVPPLSSKFGDIYPMSGYEDNSVVTAAVNGLHNDINGEAENVVLKAGVSSALRYFRLLVNFPAQFLDDVSGVHY